MWLLSCGKRLPARNCDLFTRKSFNLPTPKGDFAMNFLKNTQSNIQHSQSIVRMFFALAFLTFGASAALAQGTPPNMNFNDGPSSARYNSTGRAFVGLVTANVEGRIRDGQLKELHVTPNPDKPGSNNLKSLFIFYTPGDSAIPPRVQWYNRSSYQRLVISNVPAKEYFHGWAGWSNGVAKVEITFINGAPGKVTVSYTHKGYSSGKPPKGTRYYTGTVFSGSPLFGDRLGYQIL
jgi:hypothetical protein